VSLAESLLARWVSGETIRQMPRRLGIGWEWAKHWITNHDPE
jgi:hypothetical protein